MGALTPLDRLAEIEARLTPETNLLGMLRPDDYKTNRVELLTVVHEAEAAKVFNFLEMAHDDLTFLSAALLLSLDALEQILVIERRMGWPESNISDRARNAIANIQRLAGATK